MTRIKMPPASVGALIGGKSTSRAGLEAEEMNNRTEHGNSFDLHSTIVGFDEIWLCEPELGGVA